MIVRAAHLALLAIACLGVYSNGFDHAFLLDSGHTVVENPSVRSLANIPGFFSDPGTFTILRSNVDYRPVLQATYALNYRMGGYEMFWWHATQVLLHFICVVGLYCLCLKVTEPDPDGSAVPGRSTLALLAGVLLAVHPTASGVVNYISARSSLLTAALLLPSIVAYMVPATEDRYRKVPWLAASLFALALFTKVEAIGALAVYFMHDVWQRARSRGADARFFADLAGTINTTVLVRLSPFVVIAAIYLAVRFQVMAPYDLAEARQRAGMGSYEYLSTQLVAWWHYVHRWFAPVNLIADDLSFPVYRGFGAPPVLLAIGGWMLVATALLARWRTDAWQAFLAISALALLSPTSSVLPLAEMVNEHRPYLPIAILSLCWLVPGWRFAARVAGGDRRVQAVGALAAVLAIGALAIMTFERNRVFASPSAYWKNVVEKAPSARAHLNYGLTFLRSGDLDTAYEHFSRSLELAPYWHVTHINLAIVHRERGEHELARKHFDEAVRYETHSGTALTWRGEYNLSKGRYAEAVDDFTRALEKNLDRYRNHKGLASAYAGLGDAEKSLLHTVTCLDLDPERTARDIVAIVTPFFETPAGPAAGLEYFERLEKKLPDTWWVHANIATLADRAGNAALAERHRERAKALRSTAQGK